MSHSKPLYAALKHAALAQRVGNLPPQALNALREIQAHCPKSTSLDETPIRTIHHLSCTGGTLFAKCVAAMPNVVVLNEINPFSRMPIPKGKPPFTPTDMVALARQGENAFASDKLIKELFLDNLAVLRKECWLTGRILVLRDHSHSQFLYGELADNKPTLRDVIAERFPVISVVTTRKPENAFSSMQKYGWNKHFEPSTLEEYERREKIFRSRFKNVASFSYEEMTENPTKTMKAICNVLEIKFWPDFEKNFWAFRFSGDSGRGGKKIYS